MCEKELVHIHTHTHTISLISVQANTGHVEIAAGESGLEIRKLSDSAVCI